MNHRALLETLHLADLIEPARASEALTRADLERVLRAANPIAAAALADARRAAASNTTVTYPVTLRVRVPGVPASNEDATKVSHDVADVAAIEATEMQIVGTLPSDLRLPHAIELVRSLAAARPDLPLRAFAA